MVERKRGGGERREKGGCEDSEARALRRKDVCGGKEGDE